MEPQDPKIAAGQAATTPHAAARMTTRKAFGRGRAVRGRRAPSEGATLVCAVLVAVALGVACGAWINARLAAAAAAVTSPAPSKLLPSAVTTEQKTTATSAVVEHAPAALGTSSTPTGEAAPLPATVKTDEWGTPERDPAGTPGKVDALKRGGAASAKAANGGSRPAETAVRPDGAPAVGSKTTPGRDAAAPCAMYASAGSLAVRGGAAAPLVVGGPGEAGRVTVTTPNWADIAVINEGRAGANGWLRFSVRSVSRRPGVYTVLLTTKCGSRNIPVKVTQP